MEIQLALRGDLQVFAEKFRKAAEKGVTAGIRRSTTGLKNERRRQVKRAGLGQKLANTERGDVYPRRGASLGAAGVVRSKASFMHAFATGATITPRKQKFLAVRTEHVGQFGQRYLRPEDFKGQLTLVPSSKPNTFLLVDNSFSTPKVMFVLVKQVRIRKTLDFDGAARKWHDKLPGYIINEITRAEQRLGIANDQ